MANGSKSNDDDLFDSEATPESIGESFPPPERRVFTQPYDLSVATLVEQFDQKILIVPEMQREYVWDNGRASRLIESLLLNIPVPPVFFAETEAAKFEIIDGQQRILSVVRFIKNEFALSGLRLQGEYARLRYHQLPPREQRFLATRTLRAIVIGVDSAPSMKYEIFQRLNTGSVALNAQEVRNGLSGGSLNTALRELVKDEVFRKLMGSKSPRKRMVDEELILRFFALSDSLERYKPPLRRYLDNFMSVNKDAKGAVVEELTELFERSCRVLWDLYEGPAFRVADRKGKPTESNVNKALFDAQMLSASWVKHPEEVKANRVALLAASSGLMAQPNFADAIQRATGDRRRTLVRAAAYAGVFESAGIKMEIPLVLRDFDE